MEKNLAIIIITAAVIVLAVTGWLFFTKTNSVNIPNPGSVATTNPATVKSSEKAITAFSFSGLSPEISGVFDGTNHTITFTVPSDTDIKSLAPAISVSKNATISPDPGSFQDFSNPVIYTVTAENGSTQIYTVIVNTEEPKGPVIGS